MTPIIQESTAADINIAVIGIELCKKTTKVCKGPKGRQGVFSYKNISSLGFKSL